MLLNIFFGWLKIKKKRYYDRYNFLDQTPSTVLSSVFDDNTFAFIKMLKQKYKDVERKEWIVLGSNSWIKGYEDALVWCKNNKIDPTIVWNKPYTEVLEKLAQAKGFVYLPKGGDTCPRMVIEAKLLGCELHLNDHVQHKK